MHVFCHKLACSSVLACFAALSPLRAGQTLEPYRLTVDVPQVVLNVSVTAKDGSPVLGLKAGDFLVYDQGELQQLTAFSSEDRPATIGLVLDNSRSMRPRRREALEAAAGFVDLSHPDDDFFVVHLNENVRLGFDGGRFSTDRVQLRRALWRLHPDGQTAVYDAVLFALRHSLEGRWEKRALLVISDGGDTASAAAFDEVLEQARRLGASIYGIGLYDALAPDHSPKVLRCLAAAGGGTAYFPTAGAGLGETCERIAAEIRSQYTLAFAPGGIGSQGRFHKIRVRIKGEESEGASPRGLP